MPHRKREKFGTKKLSELIEEYSEITDAVEGDPNSYRHYNVKFSGAIKGYHSNGKIAVIEFRRK